MTAQTIEIRQDSPSEGRLGRMRTEGLPDQRTKVCTALSSEGKYPRKKCPPTS